MPVHTRHLEVGDGAVVSDERNIGLLRRAKCAAYVLDLVARAKMNIISVHTVELGLNCLTVSFGRERIA